MHANSTTPWEWGQDPLWPNPWFFSPSRKIPRSAVAITGLMTSAKAGCQVPHESLAEKRFFGILERSPGVWRYLWQPLRIPIEGAEGSNEKWYTPDVVVIFHPPADSSFRIPPLLIEVKPEKKIRVWIQDNPFKVFAAINLGRDHGWGFHMVGGLDSPGQQNDLANWIEEQSRVVVPSRFPLQRRIVASVSAWRGLPTRDIFRRLQILGFAHLEIVNALNPLLFEGFLEPSRDPYGNQILNLSRDLRAQRRLGGIS